MVFRRRYRPRGFSARGFLAAERLDCSFSGLFLSRTILGIAYDGHATGVGSTASQACKPQHRDAKLRQSARRDWPTLKRSYIFRYINIEMLDIVNHGAQSSPETKKLYF
jgi:hypothetical protein